MAWECGRENVFDLDLGEADMKRRKSAPAGRNVSDSQLNYMSEGEQHVWEPHHGSALQSENADLLHRQTRSLPKVRCKSFPCPCI